MLWCLIQMYFCIIISILALGTHLTMSQMTQTPDTLLPHSWPGHRWVRSRSWTMISNISCHLLLTHAWPETRLWCCSYQLQVLTHLLRKYEAVSCNLIPIIQVNYWNSYKWKLFLPALFKEQKMEPFKQCVERFYFS